MTGYAAEVDSACEAASDLNPAATSASRWFAVWTRSQCEPKVEESLRRKRLEVFVPRVPVASRRKDRRLVLPRPLFPGYVFLRFTPSREAYIRVAGTGGVARILGESWDTLSPIPDEQIEAVRRIVSCADGVRPVPWLRVGDRVRIVAGPLVGLEGFIQAWRAGRATFVVNVDLLKRSVAVELGTDMVVRL